MSRESHSETHALLYGIEGALSVPDHPATTAAMPHMVRQLERAARTLERTGLRAGVARAAAGVRLDIVAQAMRAAASVARGMWTRCAQVLVHYIEAGDGHPFFAGRAAPPIQRLDRDVCRAGALRRADCDPTRRAPGRVQAAAWFECCRSRSTSSISDSHER